MTIANGKAILRNSISPSESPCGGALATRWRATFPKGGSAAAEGGAAVAIAERHRLSLQDNANSFPVC